MRRTHRTLICALAIASYVVASPLAAEETLSLSDTLEALERESGRWLADDLSIREARIAYDRARAIVFPRIDLSVPLSGSTSLLNEYTTSVGASSVDVTQRGGFAANASPGVTVTQALPTSGSLSLSVADTLSLSDPGRFDPEAAGDAMPADDRLDHSLSVGLRLDQPLYFRGSAFAASLENAENALTRAAISREQARNQFALEAAELFYRIQYLAYSRTLVAARRDAAMGRLQTVEREFGLGIHTRTVLLQAQLARDRAELDLYDAARAFSDALAEFRSLYGIADTRRVEPEIEPLDLAVAPQEELVRAALAGNRQLDSLRLVARDATNAITLYESDQAPRLSVGTELSYADRSEENDVDRSSSLSGSVTLSANLFDGGTSRLRLEELGSAARRAEIEVSLAANRIEREVQSALADLDRNARYREYLETAQEIGAYEFEKGQRDRALGAITDRKLLELELELEATRLELANALVEANVTTLRLLTLQGADIIATVTGQKE